MLAPDAYAARFVLRRPPLTGLADSTLLLTRERLVGDGMRETVTVENLGREATTCVLSLEVEADALSGFGVFFLPLGPVDLFAKGGVVAWEGSVNFKSGGQISTQDGTDLAYGIGAQFRLLSISIRAEYEMFDVGDLEDANLLSIGVTYTFL